jgi:PAS domain S-box-containing protein
MITTSEVPGGNMDSPAAPDTTNARLEEVQALLETVLKAAGDALVAIDERSIIQFASPELEDLWGYRPGELIGKPLQILMPRHYRPQHTNGVRNFIERDAEDTSGYWNDVEALHKDGTEFPIWVRIRKVQHNGRFLLAAAIRDASDYHQMRDTAECALALAREQDASEEMITLLAGLVTQVEA